MASWRALFSADIFTPEAGEIFLTKCLSGHAPDAMGCVGIPLSAGKEEKLKSAIVLKKNPDMVSRTIEDETILMPLYKTSDEINCIYTLNDVAARVWELIDGKRSLEAIRSYILKEFLVTEAEMDKQMAALLKDLKEIKAVN